MNASGVPASLALIFRWTIPESARYICDTKQDSAKALWDTEAGTRALFAGWAHGGFDDMNNFKVEDVEANGGSGHG